jgi:hypothetical protein
MLGRNPQSSKNTTRIACVLRETGKIGEIYCAEQPLWDRRLCQGPRRQTVNLNGKHWASAEIQPRTSAHPRSRQLAVPCAMRLIDSKDRYFVSRKGFAILGGTATANAPEPR